MGLFDGYFDPEQFGQGGGLLGRLLALQPQLGGYRPDASIDQLRPVPQTPVLQSALWPNLPGDGLSLGAQTAAPSLASQYQALRPILGDHKAIVTAVDPDVGRRLAAQALANPQSGNTRDMLSGSSEPTSSVEQPSEQDETPQTRILARLESSIRPTVLPDGESNFAAERLASPGASNSEAITPIPASPEPTDFRLAQAIPPVFFVRPFLVPPRQLTPLEDLPLGSRGGPGAGKPFPRWMNEEQPEGVPCTYCGQRTTKAPGPAPNKYHGDHEIPRSQGGNNSRENLAPSCQTCNLEKGGRDPKQWYDSIEQRT
jgi:hypothetical protein